MSEVADNNADYLLARGQTEGAVLVGSGVNPARVGYAEISDAVGPSSWSVVLGIGRRHLLATCLTICYVLFFLSLYLADKFAATPLAIATQFGVWAVVALALLRGVTGFNAVDSSASRLDLLLAVWCNVGIVSAATLLGGEMRLLLLVGVVFGLLYSGLRFSEQRVRTVMLATIFAYAGCVFLLSTVSQLTLEFELLSALGLAVLLLASSLLAREVIRLKQQARARNRQLAQALRRVEELALRDELTGLYNRRHLLDFVDRAIAARERGGASFALAYCDLDHFKRVNDRFGHECGDRLLQSFADAARRSVRTNDLVARLGGEEFVLVLMDADQSDAAEIVERLRMQTAKLRVSSAEPGYSVTLSAGLVTHAEADTVDSLLRRADGALYEAKEQGRDQLVRA